MKLFSSTSFITQISPILNTAQICWKFFIFYFYYAYSVKAHSFILRIPEMRNVLFRVFCKHKQIHTAYLAKVPKIKPIIRNEIIFFNIFHYADFPDSIHSTNLLEFFYFLILLYVFCESAQFHYDDSRNAQCLIPSIRRTQTDSYCVFGKGAKNKTDYSE
jgi:hypothetical protein